MVPNNRFNFGKGKKSADNPNPYPLLDELAEAHLADNQAEKPPKHPIEHLPDHPIHESIFSPIEWLWIWEMTHINRLDILYLN